MAMAPNEIKAALVRAGIRQAEIARAVGKSKQYVSDVIAGNRNNEEIKQEIAARIGKPITKVFGEAA